MDKVEKRYSMPPKYIIIPKDHWYIFFDPVHFSFVRVNEHGKTILESIDTETTVLDATRKVAAKLKLDPSEINERISTFLDNMTSTRFLHEGSYKPEIEGPPDMSQSKPGSLYIHPTFKCNQQCIYCYNKKEREESTNPELTTREWFDILDQAKELGIRSIVYTGGEPLLRDDIFELAHYANGIGMSSQLLTNGRLINENNLDKIMNSFGAVGFSLDSHIKKNNDLLRGNGSYEATIKAMKLLKKNKMTFSAKSVITKFNVWDLPGLIQFFLEEFESGSIIPNLYIPPSKDMVDMLPRLADFMEASSAANEIVERHYGEDKISVLRFHGIPSRQFQCGAAAGEISMAPDGSVYPCQALQKDEFNAGNIKEKSLKEIYYTSPILSKVRNCTVDTIETCRDCDVKYLCGGGCRSLAYNLFGKIDCYNSYSCEYLKNLAYGMLWNATCIPIDQIRRLQEEVTSETEAATRPS